MSYRTLNQIFYTNNKFDDPAEIQRLESYFMNLPLDLTHDMFLPIMNMPKESVVDVFEPMATDVKNPIHVENPPYENPLYESPSYENPKKTGFLPRDKDAIFWCIFVHHHGEMEYEMIRTNYGKRKIDEKMRIYSWLKENKSAIKTFPSLKITNVMYQEMLSELMCVQSNTGFLSIIALSLYYKINIYLVNESKRVYLEFRGQTEQVESNPCILYQLERGYKLSYETSIANIDKLHPLESYQKPLKAISNYKMCELEEIATKLGLQIPAMKKPELYQTLTDHCTWK